MTFDIPRTDACPHCGANHFTVVEWECGTTPIIDGDTHRSPLCHEREARQKAEAEVKKLKDRLFPHMASAIYHMEKDDIRNKLNSLKKKMTATYTPRTDAEAEVKNYCDHKFVSVQECTLCGKTFDVLPSGNECWEGFEAVCNKIKAEAEVEKLKTDLRRYESNKNYDS